LLPRPPETGWCAKHGVPECPLDHPELAQVTGPVRFPRYDVLAALTLRERPENNSKCRSHLRRIQFASAAAAEKAGVDIDLVQEVPMTEFIAAPGEVGYDQTRVARLSSRVPGTVWRVEKQVGEVVHEGDVLALVDAVEVGRAKAEFLQAVVQFRLRAKTLEGMRSVPTAVPDRQLREAETAVSEARIRLLGACQALVNLGLPVDRDEFMGLPEDQLAARVQFLGLSGHVIERLDPRRTTANLLPIRAPLEGVVVDREVVAGEVVDTTRTLFVVADVRHVWLNLGVHQEDARHVALGLAVRFRPDGADEAAGQVTWMSTAVDEKTRTVKVRAELPNAAGRLRANTFGTGRIVWREEKYAVAVPSEAVQWDGDCFIIFVRDKHYLQEKAPKVFHVRKIRTGARDDKYTEILAGALPGEVVACKGSAVLKAELLKAGLGEG
jgi:cobalt-zinc-cadmium efflux system membrane fusion protein